MDKVYFILNEIDKNSNVTQRQLSRKTGLSLGSINLLINKMVHDGLIKISEIPLKRVVYMITPKGISEKVNKTCNYIKYHYNIINETKTKINLAIDFLVKEFGTEYILLENDEISQIVSSILPGKPIKYFRQGIDSKSKIIAVSQSSFDQLSNEGYIAYNLIEYI